MLLKDYKEEEDPVKFVSKRTARGQLKPRWQDTTSPLMCAYKLCSVEFKWFGIQSKVEKFISNVSFILRDLNQ